MKTLIGGIGTVNLSIRERRGTMPMRWKPLKIALPLGVLLWAILVSLVFGMDVTMNYEQKAVYIYLAPTEFAALTPRAIQAYICRGTLAKPTRETSYGVERRGVESDTTYEVYRERPRDEGITTLQLVMKFRLKDCLVEGR